MTNLHQLEINDLSFEQYNETEELCARQTKLITGGRGPTYYRFEGSNSKELIIRTYKKVTESQLLLTAIELAKWVNGEISGNEADSNVEKITGLSGTAVIAQTTDW